MFQMKFLIKSWPSAGPLNNCISAFLLAFISIPFGFMTIRVWGMAFVPVSWRENPVNPPLKMC